MRSTILLMAAAAGIAWGCGGSLDEALLGATCLTDDDCAGNVCAKLTAYQMLAGLTEDALTEGTCQVDATQCAAGVDPGCWCEQNAELGRWDCTGSGLRPSRQDTTCECYFSCEGSTSCTVGGTECDAVPGSTCVAGTCSTCQGSLTPTEVADDPTSSNPVCVCAPPA